LAETLGGFFVGGRERLWRYPNPVAIDQAKYPNHPSRHRIHYFLSALDVKFGPALASVGVVGLAVGFGSQALVRDILSGVFFCSKMPSGSENNSI
jgi:hypothetical protein